MSVNNTIIGNVLITKNLTVGDDLETDEVKLNGSTSGSVSIEATAATTDYKITLPDAAPTQISNLLISAANPAVATWDPKICALWTSNAVQSIPQTTFTALQFGTEFQNTGGALVRSNRTTGSNNLFTFSESGCFSISMQGTLVGMTGTNSLQTCFTVLNGAQAQDPGTTTTIRRWGFQLSSQNVFTMSCVYPATAGDTLSVWIYQTDTARNSPLNTDVAYQNILSISKV